MAWTQIGEELPVQNDNGGRPTQDEENAPRPTEFVPIEKFKELEFDINDMTSSKDRRWFDTVTQNLIKPKLSSTSMALDFEDVFRQIIHRFIRGVKHRETGKEMPKESAVEFMISEFEWEDVLALMGTIRQQVTLALSKKKNWNSLFGLGT